MLQFDRDVQDRIKSNKMENADALKVAIRAELTDDLGDEARVAFEYAIKMMRDLYHGE